MRRIILFALLVTASSCVRRAPGPTPAPPAPPVKKTPAPIEIPRREAPAVVVLPVEVRGAPLLPAEVERLRRWAGRLLATQNAVPMDVVPPEDVARFAELAANRRVSAEAPACAGTVPLWVTLEKNFPAAMRARPVAECDEDRCRFSVTVAKPGSNEVVGAWSSEVPKPSQFDQWEEAAQALAPGAPPSAPPAAAEIGAAPQDFARILRVRAFGDWGRAPDRKALERWDSLFEQCHEQGQPPRPPDTVVLELAEQGKATACGAYGSDNAPRAVLDCYCQGFRNAELGAGTAGRRLAITVQDRSDPAVYTADRERIAARLEAFSATDPALEQDAFSGLLPWTGLCYGNTRLREPLAIDVKLAVDPLGKIDSAELTHPSAPPALTACIDGYLRNIALPCTLSGAAATVTFTLNVERQSTPSAQARAAR